MMKKKPGIEGMVEYLDNMHLVFETVGKGLPSIEHLVDLGKKLNPLPQEGKTEDNRVPGCISNVYIDSYLEDGKIYFKGSSDSHVVEGYVALLSEAFSGLSPVEIVVHTRQYIEKFLKETDIKANLTQSRANALGNIYNLMLKKASAYINNK